jgi:ATP-binding cassette subfamily A (ABC1) protein 3
MEEADVLATRVAIISQRILALGTTEFLRRKHGNVYHIHIVLESAPTSTKEEMVRVEQWVERSFSGVRLDPYGNYHGQIKFSIPAHHEAYTQPTEDVITEIGISRRGGVGALLSLLEASKEAMGLQSYSVRATTMDEVFLKVIRENNIQEEGLAEGSVRRQGLLSAAKWNFWH